MKRFICLLCVFLILFSSLAPTYADSGGTTVYITRTGECYHMGSCSYLSQSKYSISLQDAVAQGYRPCSRCHPPRYDSGSTANGSAGVLQASPTSAVLTAGGFVGAGAVGYLLGRRKRR